MIMLSRYGSLLLVSLFAILMGQVGAQSPSNLSTVTSPKKFDEASIRPSPPGRSNWYGTRITGDMFEAHSMSLKSLVGYAYTFGGPKPQMVSGGEGWIESQQWDIIAKVDGRSFEGLSNAERRELIRPMVQALLEDRFHLKLHTEPRLTPVYALVQAKGGARVKEVPAPPDVQGDPIEAMKRHEEENPGKPFPGAISCADRCTATGMTISNALAQIEGSSHADRIIIDETGLKGHYDFSFRQPRNDDDDPMAEVMEDLGMKLEPRKVDLTTYVIDSAEKPTAN